MVKTWKVSWNKKLYDYKSIIESFKRGEEDIIYQSKGRARMKNEPKEGDNVYVSCNKLKIMKCMVISNFRIGHEETLDIYNRGNPRNHTNNNTYLKMKILETFDEPIILKGCQRTWSKYTAVKISNGVKQSMLSHQIITTNQIKSIKKSNRSKIKKSYKGSLKTISLSVNSGEQIVKDSFKTINVISSRTFLHPSEHF